VVIVLTIGQRFEDSDPAEKDICLIAIKIRVTTSFGGEVKPWVPCVKMLRHVTHTYSMKEILVGKIDGHFSPSLFLLRY
jgi:hypothetical protein